MPSLDQESISAYLTSFLDIVMRLERLGNGWLSAGSNISEVGSEGGDGLGRLSEAEIEERELVEWASLKECQVRFLRDCGVGLG